MDKEFLLVHKMKNGDEGAMDVFIRNYYSVILRYCQFHISNVGDSEDLVQETFLRFFKSLPGYNHHGKAKNYLYRIAGNLCKDYYRKNVEWSLLGDLELQNGQIELIEDRIDLERALHKLPEEFREVIILYYFQELQLKEIAEILDIGLPLVKYRMKKAKEQLGQTLGKEE